MIVSLEAEGTNTKNHYVVRNNNKDEDNSPKTLKEKNQC